MPRKDLLGAPGKEALVQLRVTIFSKYPQTQEMVERLHEP
jgi:hypothetical protein